MVQAILAFPDPAGDVSRMLSLSDLHYKLARGLELYTTTTAGDDAATLFSGLESLRQQALLLSFINGNFSVAQSLAIAALNEEGCGSSSGSDSSSSKGLGVRRTTKVSVSTFIGRPEAVRVHTADASPSGCYGPTVNSGVPSLPPVSSWRRQQYCDRDGAFIISLD
jgi:hypothetical protein